MSQLLLNLSTTSLVISALAVVLTYAICLTIYRVFFHPISHVPGPRLAAVTYWYECYYDVWLPGQYIFKIRDLHEKYGPIVRINPDQVHFNDPDFFDDVYAGSSRKRDKWSWEMDSFDISESVFSALGHDDHRVKRAPLNPFFSKAKVRSLQPRIMRVVDNLLLRIAEFQTSGQPLRLDWAFVCLTNDVVTEYTFGKGYDRTLKKDFDPPFQRATSANLYAATVMKHFPWLLTLMMHWLPESAVLALNPDMACYIEMQKDIKRMAREVLADQATEKPKASQTTIMHEIVYSDAPALAKSFGYLWQNGQLMLVAGTVTTAAALSVAVVHLLQQSEQLLKLRRELVTNIPNIKEPLNVTALEQLPYLTAVIQECLRVANGTTERPSRIDPERPTVFVDKLRNKGKEYVIPPLTSMASTSMLIHQNPMVYTNPMSFQPERWLAAQPPPDKYFHPFSKGTRKCMGINLAYAELYLTLAAIFRRYGSLETKMEGDLGHVELFETSDKDIEIVGDGFVPMWPKDSKGVRILVK